MRRTGFTLIELLVVIAIIAILAAILFPVFAKAREKARQSTCLNNQKQLVTAALLYAQDHDELFPEASSVWGDLEVSKGVLRCPTAARAANAYVYSQFVAGVTLGDIDTPTSAIVTADGAHTATPFTMGPPVTRATHTNVLYDETDFLERHNGERGLICSYADGHVEYVAVPPAIGGCRGTTTMTMSSRPAPSIPSPLPRHCAKSSRTWTWCGRAIRGRRSPAISSKAISKGA